MTEQEFINLRNSLKADLDLTKRNYAEKCLSLITAQLDYIAIFYKQLSIVMNLKSQLDNLKGELNHFYKIDYQYKVNTASELEILIRADKRFIVLNTEYCTQENYLKFLEKSLQLLRDANYAVKTFNDIRKVNMGD